MLSGPSPIVSKGLLSPFLRTLITHLNAFPVGGGHELNSLKLACKLLAEGKKILLFPEGTRSGDGTIHSFKRGLGMLAMRAQCPIVPTYIHGTFEASPKNKKFPSFFGKKTICVFGKPIFPHEFPQEDSKDAHDYLAKKIQEEIIALRAELI